jgi:hypothetical protein
MNLGHLNSNGFDAFVTSEDESRPKSNGWDVFLLLVESQRKKALSLRVGFVAERGICALVLSRTKLLAKLLRRFLCIR